ncbi:dienelactone hydrolase family protein [Methylobacterium sp. J-068]|uniref:dienelactone hydrolase family protein n=1 Tax=Methylobacterium sp. J-068 TaxID=2836649 RepID=UPI001FBB0756|nr:dienelactone hydrolase family protein [Methylobacterium sp. J-068]MCJ2035951.1 dienelactone hydrolase family protein [Methylobacterium sp. J-068]
MPVMRSARFGLLLLAGLAGPAHAESGEAAEYAPRVEIRAFESLTLSDAQFLSGNGEGAKPVTLAGTLRIARAGSERLPTVILMHGSGGLGGNIEFWQRKLNAGGYSTFAIDAFSGRGLTSVNTDQALLGRTTMVLDIYRALEVLARHPRVDPERVAIMGFSRGGQAALYASLTRFDAAWNRSGIRPAAYLPVYPDCSIAFLGDTEVSPSPIRILAGGDDDYNPAAACMAYLDRLSAAGRKNVAMEVYHGGQHVFDNPIGPTTPIVAAGAQTVRNCALREEAGGRIVNARTGAPFAYTDACVETGPHIGSDAGLRAKALKTTLDHLNAAFAAR